jgi:drug/metabolite transporter (DMT)-like permease
VALGLGLALAAAIAYAVAYVAQYREASQREDEGRFSIALLSSLVRRPGWVAGVAALAVGSIVQAAALGTTSLGVVEPVLMATLLFALPLGAALSRQRLTLREWAAAVAVAAGVGVLVLGAGTRHVDSTGSNLSWAVALAAVGVVVAVGTAAVPHVERRTQAVLLSSASGVLWGTSDALTKVAFRLVDKAGLAALVTSWKIYVLVVVAVAALAWSQYGYQRAALPASLPGLVIGEPIAGVLIGAAVLGTNFRTGLPWGPVEVAGAIAAVAGTAVLARSPLAVASQRVVREERERIPVGVER